jgi:hypothetical protein
VIIKRSQPRPRSISPKRSRRENWRGDCFDVLPSAQLKRLSMRLLRAATLALATLTTCAPAASAATIFLPGVNLASGWNDVNKTSLVGNPDSVLCWAAAASNILSYTGWWGWDGVQYLDSPAEIYQRFDQDWSNRLGDPTRAYEWWMTNRTQSNIPVYVFDSPGLNFFPGVNVQNGPGSVTAFVDTDPAGVDVPGVIAGYINDQRGLAIAITINNPNGGGTYGHVVTVWGWDGATNTLYFTDSDDQATTLRSLNLTTDGSFWYLHNYTNAYTNATDAKIGDVVRLNRNIDPFIQPAGFDAAAGTVPEPATLGLLAAGLAAAVRKRRARTGN